VSSAGRGDLSGLARRNFLVVWWSTFITSVGMMGFLPFIPLYVEELGVVDEDALRVWSGVIVGAAPLLAALMAPLWGAFSDRLGRKLMIMRANMAIVLFVGAMGFVTSPWQMLALRLGQGVFSGFIAPAMTLVSVSTPANRQARTAANLQMALMAGGIVGPIMGGAIADAFSYSTVFVVCSGLSVLATLLVWGFVTEPQAAEESSPKQVHAFGLLRSILRDMAMFLKHPVLRVVLAGAFAVRFGASLLDPLLALWVETRSGFDLNRLEAVTGMVFGAQALATLLFTPVWGRIGDRLGNRRLLAICAAGAGLAYLGQRVVDDVTLLTILRFVSGAFVAGIVPAAFSAAARNSPVEKRGAAQGLTFSAVVLARATAPVSGGLLGAAFGLGPLFVLAALLMFVTSAMALRSSSETSHQESGDQPTRR
jgi:MFS transporter, DHA1 family, multidrug resistance protein